VRARVNRAGLSWGGARQEAPGSEWVTGSLRSIDGAGRLGTYDESTSPTQPEPLQGELTVAAINAISSSDRRRIRARPSVKRIGQSTWYGTCAITVATALRELPYEGRVALLRDLQAHLKRQAAEIERHQRGRTQ